MLQTAAFKSLNYVYILLNLGVGQYLYLLLFTYPREVLKIHLFIIGFRF